MTTTRSYRLQAVDMSRGRRIGAPRYVTELTPAEPADTPPEVDTPDPVPYPEGGSVADVLAWVNDPAINHAIRSERAKVAVVTEHGRGKPRTTLLTELSERTRP